MKQRDTPRNVPGDTGLCALVPRGSAEPALRFVDERSLLDMLGCDGKDISLSPSPGCMLGVTLRAGQ